MSDPATIQDLEGVFGSILNVILGFAAIALFLLFIIGGYKYITSGGNPDRAASARSTITYAIIGTLIILLSFLILYFISEFTGAPVTKFIITQ